MTITDVPPPASSIAPAILVTADADPPAALDLTLGGWDPLCAEYRVGDAHALPAAAFVEFALQAGTALFGGRARVLDLTVAQPLVLGADESVRLRVSLGSPAIAGGARSIAIRSSRDGGSTWVEHATGSIAPASARAGAATASANVTPRSGTAPTFDGAALYQRFAASGLHHGATFRWVQAVWTVNDDVAIASLSPPRALSEDPRRFVIHPALLDAAIQTAMALLGRRGIDRGAAAAFAPIRFTDCDVLASPVSGGELQAVARIVPASNAASGGESVSVEISIAESDGPLIARARLLVAPLVLPASVDATRATAPAPASHDQVDPPAPVAAARQVLDGAIALAATEILQRLGAVGERLSPAPRRQCFERAGVTEGYERLFHFLVEVACEDGQLREDGEGLRLAGAETVAPGRAAEVLAQSRSLLAPFAGEVALLERCLTFYPEIMQGKRDPLTVLFPKGDLTALEAIYRDSPLARRTAAAITAEVAKAVAARAPAGQVRLIEIGAGTGGTTAAIVPALRPWAAQIDYRYTDLAPVFLSHGRQRFGQEGFVSFGAFDIERDPAAQGIAAGGWDVVLAAHVFHATRDVRRTLQNARALLKPDGVLLFIETQEPRHRWINCIFGLTAGWWRFDGADQRTQSPLLDRERWFSALRGAGFRAPSVISPPGPDGDEAMAVFGASADPGWRPAPAAAAAAPAPQIVAESPNRPAAVGELQGRLETFIRTRLAQSLKISVDQVTAEGEFRDIGLDSILAQDLLAGLEQLVGAPVSATALFEAASVRALAQFVAREFATSATLAAALAAVDGGGGDHGAREARASAGAAPASAPQVLSSATSPAPSIGRRAPIAVIGYACRVPGAPTADAFWQLLREGRDAISEIPPDRWPLASFYSPDPDAPGRSYSKWAGLIEEPRRFDADFFRISGREVRSVDPQQRLLLQTSWEALEHAGHAGHVAGQPVGVFVGASTSDYAELLLDSINTDPSLSRYFVSGSAPSFLSNRLSFTLGVSGPSLTVDTACSSSLVAAHLACTSLLNDECDVALAAGVNVCLTPTVFKALSKARALSPTGRCRPFSDDADGYVRGEGACVVVLKRLDRAIADGDQIHAVILGSAVNHAGQTNGATVPSPEAQSEVIRRALRAANAGAESISYVECHGTGTRLGDPIEVESLTAAHQRTTRCPIGSLKGNIGHLEAAAGVTALLKVVLALEHGEIPPSIQLRAPNPLIRFDRIPFFVNQSVLPWPSPPGEPARGAVSSFGLGGSNAHFILEQAPVQAQRSSAQGPFLLPLSALTAPALEKTVARWRAHVAGDPALDLRDACWTAAVGRLHGACRAAFVFQDRRELLEQLASFDGKPRPERGVWSGRAAAANPTTNGANGAGAAHDLKATALAFVRGESDHPEIVFAGQAGRRVPLPTYPFEDTGGKGLAWTERAPAAAVNAAAPQALETTVVMSAPELPFDDHRVRGQTVFPGVGWLQAAYRAAPSLLGQEVAVVEGLSFLRPLALPSGAAGVSVSVKAERVAADTSLLPFAISPAGGERTASGYFRRDQPERPAPVDLFDLSAACTDKQDVRGAYAHFSRAGLDYGPHFQTLHTLRYGADRVFVELRANPADGGDPRFCHVGLIDGAFQACALFAHQRAGGSHETFMPFHLERCVLWQALPPRIFGLGRVRSTSDRSDRIEFDVVLHDENGQVLGDLRGVSLKKVPLGASAGASPAPSPAAPAHRPLASSGEARIFQLGWTEVAAASRSLAPGCWLLVRGTDRSLADEIAHCAPLAGREIVNAGPGSAFERAAAGDYLLDLTSPEQLRQLLDAVGPVAGIIHLADAEPRVGSRPDAALAPSAAVLRERLDRQVQGLLALIQAAAKREGLCELWYFCRDASSIGEHAACIGLIKTLAQESDVVCRAVAIEDPGSAAAPQIVEELGLAGGASIRRRGGRRWRQAVETAAIDAGARPARSVFAGLEGAVLIVGGASGLGLTFAQEVLANSSASVVVVHRSSREVYTDALSALDPSGRRVHFAQADVCDLGAMRDVVADARRHFGPVRAVIHSAGVLHDRHLMQLRPGELRGVLGPKVEGVWVLDQVTRDEPVEIFYLFSSISAITGSARQGAHVAGNSYENTLGAALRKAGRPVQVISWGVWAETGSVCHPTYLAAVRERGIVPLSTADAMNAWRIAAAQGITDPVIASFDPDRVPPRVREYLDLSSIVMSRPDVSVAIPPAPVTSSEVERGDRLTRQRAAAALGPWMTAELQRAGELSEAALRERLGVQPRFERLFGAIVRMLVAEGLIGVRADRLQALPAPPLAAPHDIERQVREQLPQLAVPYAFLDRCLGGYIDALTGRREALSLLFHDGSMDAVLELYTQAPIFAYVNGRVRAAVERLVADRTATRPLRVLEIGAGTGSITSVAASVLAGSCAEYHFTDISAAFLRRARARFADHSFMRYGVLDVSRSPAEQGFASGSFDLVLAANVLHATRDLRETVRNVNQLLAPGGHLVLLEVTDPGPWGDLVFGLTDGWWLFQDRDLRPLSPCVSTATWKRVLSDEGFGAAEIFTPEGIGQVALVVAKERNASATPVLAAALAVTAPGAEVIRPGGAAPRAADQLAAGAMIAALEADLSADLARALERSPDRIDRNQSFAEFGLDSLMAMEITAKLSKKVGQPVSPGVFFDHPTVSRLASYLAATYGDRLGTARPAAAPAAAPIAEPPAVPLAPAAAAALSAPAVVPPASEAPLIAPSPGVAVSTPMPTPAPPARESITSAFVPAATADDLDAAIAIIGLGCRFPGAANPRAFWRLLEQGDRAIGPAPAGRWRSTQYLDRHRRQRGNEGFTPVAGFLTDDVHAFDAATFRISPAEAKFIDPQQRLFAEVAWETLEDAAYGGEALHDREVGVFVGASTGHYHEDMGRLFEAGVAIDPAMSLGNSNAVIANRVSYALNLRGPSLTIDTLCSSSLVAIHLAAQAIRRHECELALAGGVHLHLSPSSIVMNSQLGALSPSGASRTFDALADGFATGEGAGAVMLKPLHRALADGDHVYAVIRGSATIHGGRSNGLAAPNGIAQEAMIRKALAQAKLDGGSVQLVEGHGAATRIGDPVEVAALSRAYGGGQARRGDCALGSVKTNFGHLEAAAGVAGFMKVTLALANQRLPPSLNFDVPNGLLELERSPFFVPIKSVPWPARAGEPRRGAISSFGLGGVYAHAILEQAPQRARRAPATGIPLALVVSARTETALSAMVARLATWTDEVSHADVPAADICFSLAQGRAHLAHRAAFVVNDRRALDAQIEAGLPAAAARGSVTGVRPSVVLDFGAGETDFAPGDLELVSAAYPAFRAAAAEFDRDAGGEPAAGDGHTNGTPHARVVAARAAIGALRSRCAFAKLWMSWGVEPSQAVGRGLGAWAAGIVSGRLTASAAVRKIWDAEPLGAGEESGAHVFTEAALVLELAPGQASAPDRIQPFAAGAGEGILASLARAQGALFVRGVDLRWSSIQDGSGAQRVPLPTYPFERQHYELPPAPVAVVSAPLPSSPAVARDRAEESDVRPAPGPGEPLYWEAQWQRTPLAGGSAPGETHWLVFLDESGVGADLVTRLRAEGRRVITVRRGRELRRLGPDAFSLDPSDPAAAAALLTQLDAGDPGALGVVYGWGLEARVWQHPSLSSLEESLTSGPYLLAELVAALGARRRAPAPVSLWVLTNNSAAVVSGDEPIRADAAALAALAGVIRHEYGWWRVRAVDLDLDSADATVLADQAMAEIRAAAAPVAGEPQLSAWRGGDRWVTRVVPATPRTARAPFRTGGVYLIVGGKNGLGLEVARLLARKYQARVALLSRSPAPVGFDLGVPGAAWMTIEADVADLAQMRTALDRVREKWGPINGVIHAGGIVHDRLLRDSTRADLAKVVAPKVLGTWVLEQITRTDPLDAFILFSSAATVLCPPGQSAHALANGFQDGFAAQRRSLGRPAVAIDWGLWSEIGYAVRERAVERVEKIGLRGLTTSEGLACFEAAAGDDRPRVIAAGLARVLDQDVFSAAAPAVAAPEAARAPAAAPVVTLPAPPVVAPPSVAEAAPRLQEAEVVDELIALLARSLEVPASEVNPELPLMELGLDSVRSTDIVDGANRRYGVALTPEVIFKYPTIRTLARHIVAEAPRVEVSIPAPPSLSAPPAAAPASIAAAATIALPRPEPALAADTIVVIGMACRLPGADSPEELWEQVAGGRHLVRALPEERRALGYGHAAGEPGIWGAYLDDVTGFDPLFFGLSPRDTDSMDPQQRLMLECAHHALEDASRAGRDLAGSSTGVFIGATTGEFNDVIGRKGGVPDRGLGAGLAPSIVANRISYCFDLRGPSVLVDTACSSSLVAVHMACESLRRGESRMAIAGGVSLMLSARRHRIVASAGVLAPDDKCKTFAAGADGYTRGEGVGAVILKRYADAVKDRDRIRAVILGSAVNQDGRTNGISAPNPDAQRDVILACSDRAGVDLATVGLVEAHGTGTHLGDRIEVAALSAAFEHFTQRRAFCALGSIKTNVGHLEPAAGIASLIKSIAALEARTLPPTLHFEVPNPDLEICRSPFYVNTHTRPWLAGELSRRAAISAFGFGGTNCHMLVQEAPAIIRSPASVERGARPMVLALSARTERSLKQLIARVVTQLSATDERELPDLIFSMNVGRRALALRAAVVGVSAAELIAALETAAATPVVRPGRRWLAQISIEDRTRADEARAWLARWGVPAENLAGSDAAPVNDPDRPVADLRALLAQQPPGWEMEAAARLWLVGCDLDWDAFHSAGGHRRVRTPAYPFDRSRFWVDVVPAPAPAQTAAAESQVESLAAGNRPQPAATPPPRAGVAPGQPTSWRPIWREQSERVPPGSAASAPPPGTWWLVNASADHLAAFRALLPAHRLVAVSASSLEDGDSVARLRVDTPSHVLFLGEPRDLGAQRLTDPATVQAAVAERVEPFLHLARAISEWRREFDLRLYVVTDDSAAAAPIEESLRSLARAAARELRRTDVSILRLESVGARTASERAAAIVSEVARGAPGAEIRLVAGVRSRRVLEQVALPDGAGAFDASGVYLLVGGGTGIGAALALDLARRGAAVAVIGRSPPAERAELMQKIERAGGQALYVQADAGSPPQMADAFRKVRRRFGRITGIFHLSGKVDLETFSLANKSIAGWRAVQHPKVTGAAVVAQLVATGAPPSFVVLFSSLAAVSPLAASGMADYAAANGFLDGLAARLRAKAEAGSTRWISINWSIWRGVGMGAHGTGSRSLDELGVMPLEAEQALRQLAAIVASGESQVVALGACRDAELDPEVLVEHRASREPNRAAAVPAPGAGAAPATPSAPEHAPAFAKTARAGRRDRDVESFLLTTVARLLRIDAAEIDPEESLVHYGVDSMVVADLLSAVEKQYGRSIDPTAILENPTVRRIAEHLNRPDGSAAALSSAPPAGQPTEDGMIMTHAKPETRRRNHPGAEGFVLSPTGGRRRDQ